MSARFVRLTRPTIRALSSGASVSEHGIVATKLKSGDVRYSINVMVDGQRIHRAVGRESEGVTRHQAELVIEKLRTDARDDRLNLPTGRKLHTTFAEAAERYILRMEASGGRDMANKTRHLRFYLVPHLGPTRLDKLTEFELRKYRKARVTAGASDATVNRELATLLHLLNRAASKDWRWIKPDDRPTIPRVAEQRKPRRALTLEERAILMQAAREDCDPRLWLFLAVGMGTGMRHGEIVVRRYDEIDWSTNRFEIGKAKAGSRLQPFPIWVREALLAQRGVEEDPDGWLFPAKRKNCKTGHVRSMDDGFRRAVKRAGLDPTKVTPHLMRHTLVTDLSRTVDDATIQQISGHKTAAMVRHYTHVNDERIDLALAAIDRVPCAITPELHTIDELQADAQTPKVSKHEVKSAA